MRVATPSFSLLPAGGALWAACVVVTGNLPDRQGAAGGGWIARHLTWSRALVRTQMDRPW